METVGVEASGVEASGVEAAGRFLDFFRGGVGSGGTLPPSAN